jgi:hypothetical protein
VIDCYRSRTGDGSGGTLEVKVPAASAWRHATMDDAFFIFDPLEFLLVAPLRHKVALLTTLLIPKYWTIPKYCNKGALRIVTAM